MTKACVSERADYNKNGIVDIQEWDFISGVSTNDKINTVFSYFIELHTSWFEEVPAVACNTAAGVSCGRYVIKEKSRSISAGANNVVLDYALPETGWRTCLRKRDTDHLTPLPVGNDYARWKSLDGGWLGMTHGSQFKCVQVTDSGGAQLHQMSESEVQADYIQNICSGIDASVPETFGPVSGITNPTDLPLNCDSSADLKDGAVGWALVRSDGDSNFGTYPLPSGYQKGCIDECVDRHTTFFRSQCDSSKSPLMCKPQSPANFGLSEYLACGEFASTATGSGATELTSPTMSLKGGIFGLPLTGDNNLTGGNYQLQRMTLEP